MEDESGTKRSIRQTHGSGGRNQNRYSSGIWEVEDRFKISIRRIYGGGGLDQNRYSSDTWEEFGWAKKQYSTGCMGVEDGTENNLIPLLW